MEPNEDATSTETPIEAEAAQRPAAEVRASKRLRSILESLLFSSAEPVPLSKLLAVLPGYEKRDVVRALAALAEEYATDERGFRLQQVGGGYQLRTAPANAEFVKASLALRPVRLTRASLETLAVIAYRQPVTRAEIEAIRGVDADAVLATLLERRLVRVLGRKDVVGRPLLYGTTAEFLETFGLKDLASLPTLEELGASADALDEAARAAEMAASEQVAAEASTAEPPLEGASAAPGEEPEADG
jgi:segregation and condensation protein B